MVAADYVSVLYACEIVFSKYKEDVFKWGSFTWKMIYLWTGGCKEAKKGKVVEGKKRSVATEKQWKIMEEKYWYYCDIVYINWHLYPLCVLLGFLLLLPAQYALCQISPSSLDYTRFCLFYLNFPLYLISLQPGYCYIIFSCNILFSFFTNLQIIVIVENDFEKLLINISQVWQWHFQIAYFVPIHEKCNKIDRDFYLKMTEIITSNANCLSVSLGRRLFF